MARTRALVERPVSVYEAIDRVVVSEGICQIYTDLIRGHMDRAAKTARDVVALTDPEYLRDKLKRQGVSEEDLSTLFALVAQ